jgi:hypothetical protein
MNAKLNFVTNQEFLEPETIIKQRQSEFSDILEILDTRFEFRGELRSKWNMLLNFPEYETVKEENTFKIKCNSDNISVATVDNENLAANIVELMNLAYREGAKQFIQLLNR